MYLGLDLRGGVHFLLQVDMKARDHQALDSYAADIRTHAARRSASIRYGGIAREGRPRSWCSFRDSDARARAQR